MNTTHIIHPKHRPFEPKSRGWYVLPSVRFYTRVKARKAPENRGMYAPSTPLLRDIDRGKIVVWYYEYYPHNVVSAIANSLSPSAGECFCLQINLQP